MTPRGAVSAPDSVAPPARAPGAPAWPFRRAWRLPLAAKLAAALIGLVALVLLVNGGIEAWLGYDQAKRAALEVQSEKAGAAAVQVEAFLSDIETQLGWTTGAEWGYGKPEQQRYDFIRLLRETPAITALAYIDGHGKEQLAVSRLEPDSIGSGRDFSSDPRFVRAVADKVWFGPVEFRRGSEPYMTIAVAHVGKAPGVTVADVNLKLIWDVISAIHVGEKGFAYVVDDRGRLIADPDLSLVLRDTDLSALPQVQAALARLKSDETARGGATPLVGSAEIAKGRDGGAVLTAYAIAPKPRWIVFVQQPLAEAFAPVTQSLIRTGALLGLGLLLALVSGAALARRMTAPIRALQAGAERLGAGELGQRIDVKTGDEIEALAGSFNQMAGRLKESYETLEAKVESRTRDLNETLQQQTATADVLKVISRSPFDLSASFSALMNSALWLIGAKSGSIFLKRGDTFEVRATGGELERPEFYRRLDALGSKLSRETLIGRVLLSEDVVNIADVSSDPDYDPELKATMSYSAILGVPLRRGDAVIGGFSLTRRQAGAFTLRHIELMQTFADQAVIAIENTRLFDEVQARTKDLQEALQQQTATADVLKVISRAAFDLQTVFDTLVDSAFRLCGAMMSLIYLRGEDGFECKAIAADAGVETGAADRLFKGRPIRGGRGTAAERTILSGKVESIEDLLADPDASASVRAAIEQASARGSAFGRVRSTLAAPMKRENEVVGVLVIASPQTGAFPQRQIELLQTFADQAVIAIENVRLFDEVQARTRDLTDALQLQTATSDVLKVISRSAFDLQAVFNTLVSSAVELGGALTGTLCVRDGDVFRYRDTIGAEHTSALAEYLRNHPATPGRSTIAGRVLLSGKVERIPDCLADPEYVVPMGSLATNVRSLLGVPLLRKDGVEGAIILTRVEPGHFSDRQVEIVQTFADQAVIALENVRLFDEVQARTRELAASLDDLRKAQDRLIQSEKLASLGQLTAGIAHEIKNPLNFINNFSSLSRELMDELRAMLEAAPLDNRLREEAEELIGTIDANLDKVVSHGKRADSIVKNMLLHSRQGSSERTSVDVNAMVEEALNLAYHGARAEKSGFNVTIEKSLDPAAGAAELYAQEINRVLLNLISNGFYATMKRREAEGNGDYEPTLTASTHDLGDRVEIAIRDNGAGIPEEVKAKMFNPFFTTKPAGEGTGLGLSLSHDIVVKQHGGTIEVATEPGRFTEFTIIVPRSGAGR